MRIKNYMVFIGLAAAFWSWPAVAQRPYEPGPRTMKGADTNQIKKLLETSLAFIWREGEYKVDIDSGLYYAEKAVAYSLDPAIDRIWWMRSMEQKGTCFLEARNVVAGRKCFQEVIDWLVKRREWRAAAETWTALGGSIDDHRNEMSREKESSYRHAMDIYSQLGDSLNVVLSLKEIADVHLNEGKLNMAEEELLKVLDFMKRKGYPRLHDTYFLLSAVSRLKGDLKKELFYCIEVIRSMEATGDSAHAGLFYGKLSQTYDALERYDQSIVYRENAIAADRRVKDFDALYYDLQELSQEMIFAGRAPEAVGKINAAVGADPPVSLYQRNLAAKSLGNCYAALRKKERAEAFYLKMVGTSDSLFKGKSWNAEDYLRDYQTITDFYISEGQFGKAEVYIGRMLELPQKIVSPMNVSRIHLQEFKVDSAAGRFASAIGHFETYKRINDSLLNAQKQKQINELQVQYETSQKDKDLQLQAKNIQLLTKQTQLQKSESDKGRILRNVLLTGLGLVLLLLIALYSRYRLKTRTNRQLQDQKSEISGKNQELQRLLQDNEWLLKEVHHRVKNNLQIVVSLLSSQSAYLQDKNALNAVLDSQHRIQAMSLIHQKLYKSANASSVYMPDFITELVEYLKESFNTRQRIFFQQELEGVLLDGVSAVPLGLILNEAITNSIKYAFPEPCEGEISIRLSRREDGMISLVMADNGVGLPAGFDIEATETFGLVLIQGLVEDLRGVLKISGLPGNGVQMEVVFSDAGPGSREGRAAIV